MLWNDTFMKISSYSPVKCFYRKFKKMENNQLIASRRIDYGFIEVIYWNEYFEIYLRVPKKRYGYFLKTFSKLNQALNFIENAEDIDFNKLLPAELLETNSNKHKFPFGLIFNR